MLIKFIFSVALSIGFFSMSQAQNVIDYHPTNSIRLGDGVDPCDHTRSFNPCTTFERVPEKEGIPEVRFSVLELKSKKDLYELVDASLSIQARSTFGSGSYGRSLFKSSKFYSDSLYWAVTAFVNFGFMRAENQVPTERGRKAAKLGRPLFNNVCGSHFASRAQRIMRITAIYSIRMVDTELLKSFKENIQATGRVKSFSGSFKKKYETFMKQAILNTRLSVSLHGIGVSQKILKDLSQIVKDPSIEKTATAIANVFSNSSFETATVGFLRTSDYVTVFPELGLHRGQLHKIDRESAIQRAVGLLEDAVDVISRLEARDPVVEVEFLIEDDTSEDDKGLLRQEAQNSDGYRLKKIREYSEFAANLYRKATACKYSKSKELIQKNCSSIFTSLLPVIDWDRVIDKKYRKKRKKACDKLKVDFKIYFGDSTPKYPRGLSDVQGAFACNSKLAIELLREISTSFATVPIRRSAKHFLNNIEYNYVLPGSRISEFKCGANLVNPVSGYLQWAYFNDKDPDSGSRIAYANDFYIFRDNIINDMCRW